MQARRIKSMRDLMEIYGKSRSSIYRLVHKGVIPKPFKVGGTLGWYSDEIEAAMNALGEQRDNA